MENGKLHINSPIDHTGVDITKITSNKLAIEFDVQILEFGNEAHCIQELSGYEGSGASAVMSLEFHSDGHGAVSHFVPSIDGHRPLAGFEIDQNNPIYFRFLMIDDAIAAFINGRLAYTLLNPDGSVIVSSQQLSANSSKCEFDNYKIWDLRGVDFNLEEH
jgi:hypothetical protein